MIRIAKSKISQHRYTILYVLISIVYFLNLFIDVMEIDAAQYALISMEMGWTKSFLEVYQQGKDYLDKPPLLFWLSSISMLVFGISNFAYKLPSVLIAILGIYSTYQFAKHFYSIQIAKLSALILASCQALFLITNDVRTDTNLLGLTIFSVWQLSEYLRLSKWKNLIFSAIGIGGAMMAKGPIALIIPVAAFGTDFLLKRQWHNIFKPQWIILLIIIAITLIPMSYGLYTQFDLHPEKHVYGLQGPSGLRFFFWTQSFGRITGESTWNNGAGFFTFFHTILWDFQPWILLFIPALVLKFRKIFVEKFRASENEEYISFGGFVLVFLALSTSKFKLPHYIFVLFPFASIIVVDFIYQLKGKLQSRVSKIQFGIMHLFWILMIINFIFIFPAKTFVLPIILLFLLIVNWVIFYKLKSTSERIFIPTIITAVSFNLLMATSFYPNLLKFQSTSQLGRFVQESKVEQNMLYLYNRKKAHYALDFYAKRITPNVNLKEIKNLKKGSWVFTSKEGLGKIKQNETPFKVIKTFPSFHVTALEFSFLYHKTRTQTLDTEYLIEIL